MSLCAEQFPPPYGIKTTYSSGKYSNTARAARVVLRLFLIDLLEVQREWSMEHAVRFYDVLRTPLAAAEVSTCVVFGFLMTLTRLMFKPAHVLRPYKKYSFDTRRTLSTRSWRKHSINTCGSMYVIANRPYEKEICTAAESRAIGAVPSQRSFRSGLICLHSWWRDLEREMRSR